MGDSRVRREEIHDIMNRYESVLRNISSLRKKLRNRDLSGERKRSYFLQLRKLEECCQKLLRAMSAE